MAHKKGVGSSKNGRESESKRLGVKIFGGQARIITVKRGDVLCLSQSDSTQLISFYGGVLSITFHTPYSQQ